MQEKFVEISDELAYRTIQGEARIVSIRDSRLHHLDPIATFLWEQLAMGHGRVAELVAALTEQFAVEPEQARLDIERFLEELRQLGLIRWRAP